MQEMTKKIIKKITIVITAIIAVIFLLILLYSGIIYIDFLSNRNSIFSKIEEFAKAMKVQDETNISLGEEDLGHQKPSYILDRNKNIIAKYSPQKHKIVSLEQMPFFLTRGYLLAEDRAFYRHHGINYKRITYSLFKYIITLGHSGGGSTISQQLAKILFTKHERNFKRKIYEYYCTKELEKRFTKNEILVIYLNSIYLGHGTYGVANAINFYFGKTPAEVTIAEAALLIGMNRSPERYSPIKNKENAKRIQKVVLAQFRNAGYISNSDIDIEIERFWKDYDSNGVKGVQSFWKTEINRSGYLTEYIRQMLERELSYEKITKGGLKVETTFDLEKQLLAEKTISNQIKAIRKKILQTAKKRGLKTYDNNFVNQIESSFVSLNYNTGEVLTMVGGSGYNFANQLNRAVQTFRPIGSSVKPFIYAYALENSQLEDAKFHPFSKFLDETVTYKINGKKYTPKNYHGKASGKMTTLYDAVKTSLNTIAVGIMNNLDHDKVADFIKNTTNLKKNSKRVPAVLSLALGTCELSTLELAVAYAIFPRAGKGIYPIMIKKIYDDSGNVYYDINRENNQQFNWLYPKKERIEKEHISPGTAYEIVQMLKGIFEKNGTGYWPAYMTGLKKEAFAKSGTSQNFNDGWFAGFTNNEVSVAWVGFDNNKSILLPGSSTAGLIWCDYNTRVPANFINQIEIPKNMKLLKICEETGLIAGHNCPKTKKFYFKKEGAFPERCYIHQDQSDISTFDEDL